jgi:hypothetical protein
LNNIEESYNEIKKERKVKTLGKAFGTFDELLDSIDSTAKSSSDPTKVKKKKKDKQKGRTKSIKRNKQRKKVMNQEVNLFAKVLNHPEFQKDSISSIQQHLSNTI